MRGYIRDKKAFLGRSGISGYIYSAEGSLVTLKNCAMDEVTDYFIRANGTISKPTHNILNIRRDVGRSFRGVNFSTDLNGVVTVKGILDDYKNGNYGSETPMTYTWVGDEMFGGERYYTEHTTDGNYKLSYEVSGEGASYVRVAWWLYDETYTSIKAALITSTSPNKILSSLKGYKSAIRIEAAHCVNIPINCTLKIVLQKVADDGTTSAIYKPYGHETTIIDGSYTHRIFTKSPVTYGSLISYSDQAITYASGDVEKIIVPTLPCNKGGDTTLAVDSDATINVTYFSNGG
jgi:hypothetical protein